MARIPDFKDADPNIRMARRIAYKYLYRTKLRNPPYDGQHLKPRNLHDTLVAELGLGQDDTSIMEALAQMHSDVPPREYDPERERRETTDMEHAHQDAERKAELERIFAALVTLADKTKSELDQETLTQDILPALKTAAPFLAQKMLISASQRTVQSEENLHHVDTIAREINAKLYPGLSDPQSAEYTQSDHRHTRNILQYVHQTSRVIELALNDMLTAVHEINAAFEGKGPLRPGNKGLQP